MRYALVSFARNLAAGARLAFFLPVTRLAFRIDVAQLLLLFCLSAVIDVAADAWRHSPDPQFSWFGAGSELFGLGALVATAAVIAVAVRQPALTLALPVIVLAAFPAVQVAHVVTPLLFEFVPQSRPFARWADFAVLGWMLLLMVRAVALTLAPARPYRWPRALLAGAALAAPVAYAPWISPGHSWFESAAPYVDAALPSPVAEPVLAAQRQLLDDALAALEDRDPGRTNLYFVGFAPDGREEVFRKDVSAARRIMDERWHTAGRSIVLVNSRRTLLETPLATVTNLRETLAEIAGAMDPEQDVLMLYIASHGGADHVLTAELPPLQLVPLDPKLLRKLLDDAGIRWRIIVVSACYSGGFVAPLADESTLVITAAQSDRMSFGCGNDSASTFFGEAFFQQGLVHAPTIPAAFDRARVRVAERERTEGMTPPSNPQIQVGAAMQEKLRSLDAGPQEGMHTTALRSRHSPRR